MTNQQHPITPPPELVEQWIDFQEFTAAARWGADQELKACCDAIYLHEELPLHGGTAEWLRNVRRPKPPNLKEQALEVFEALIHGDASGLDVGVIRRALEALPND